MEPLDARLDHVAVAVPDLEAAMAARWTTGLGGVPVGGDDIGAFATRHLRFRGGGKLELLAPSALDDDPESFVRRFLDRYGATVHHVTVKVAELHPALQRVRDGGFDVVDVRDDYPEWQEGFLRPSQVGGLVVQIASSTLSDVDWAFRSGFDDAEPGADAAVLRGATLRHPDPVAARWLWELLGADVTEEAGDRLRALWPDSPLDLVVEAGEPAGPVGLRIDGAPAEDAVADVGPALLPEAGSSEP